ncbi:metallo-beta-lactamase superfamily protein [Terfezia boudieri ATCC MYA-4762]|uniref:Metallo-beta-lactamase superfamily protein n=1 Tax=Terfezia boudieri ATCC MYA-4762 TaxID=1051890 RepID=A0A3N4M362_9PEZI|nr:metallo-beta-lactamase superfamily protein [Terfezia boudieri ATCC MYA-4762]
MSVFGTLPDTKRLSKRVIRIMGGNPGKFTLQGSNTYLIGTGDKRILIDTGAGHEHWIKTLEKVLADEKAEVSTALVTHWHYDHVGGIADLKKISPGTVVYKNRPSGGQEDITDRQVFSVEGASLTAYYTPGHTVDHMCFFLSEESALFTGDNVLGHGTSVFEDLATYLSSLEKMKEIPALSGRGYPGHGEVLDDAKDAVDGYIAHRMARERQVLMVMKEGHPLGGDEVMTAMEMVRLIYKEIPRELWSTAEMGVVQILEKLEGEKKVLREGEGWVLWERAGLA